MFYKILRQIFIGMITAGFILQSVIPSGAQMNGIVLPPAGTMVLSSRAFYPMVLKGVTIHPDNPLQLDFVLDAGDSELSGEDARQQAQRLVDYFMASLTVPSGDLWVNLSPIEHDRIVPEALGQTELGRDMLAQDYILKQLTASLMYPEQELGKVFWNRLADEAYKRYGITELPENPFHKVWIMPDHARVYEQGTSVFVIDGHLKVMLEEDYLMGEKAVSLRGAEGDAASSEDGEIASQRTLAMTETKDILKGLIRGIILPEIEKEVNTGENFSTLRQIYNSLILAKWYKERIKNSDLSALYVDQNKVSGVDLKDTQYKEQIYRQYVQAYKQGVFDFIKDDYDPASGQVVSRKYFSGGIQDAPITTDLGSLAELKESFHGQSYEFRLGMNPQNTAQPINAAMMVTYTGAVSEEKQYLRDSPIAESLSQEEFPELYKALNTVQVYKDDVEDVALKIIPTKNINVGAFRANGTIYIERAFIEKMQRLHAVKWEERLFAYLFSDGSNRLARLKDEVEYAQHIGIAEVLPDSTIEKSLQNHQDEIVVGSKSFKMQSFRRYIRWQGSMTALREEARETSEQLARRSQEMVYATVITILNGESIPGAPVRSSDDDPPLPPNTHLNVALFPFAGNTVTDAHSEIVTASVISVAKVDTVLPSVTKGDYRKPGLLYTFLIRNRLVKNLFDKIMPGLAKLFTLPENKDYGKNGEEKIEDFVEYNKDAKSIRIVYIAGQDHHAVFARDKKTGEVVFETITDNNRQDFLYYFRMPGFAKLLEDFLRIDAEAIPEHQKVLWKKFIEVSQEGPEAIDRFLVKGIKVPKLDTVGKLILIQDLMDRKYGAGKVRIEFMYTERSGEEQADKARDELNFPTIKNIGIEGDISSTRLRKGIEKVVIHGELDLNLLFAMPKTVFKFLFSRTEESREYLYSLIRFQKKRFSKNIARYYPLSQRKNVEFEDKKLKQLKTELNAIHEKLRIFDSENNEKSSSEIRVSDHDTEDETALFKLVYKVENGLSSEGKALNRILIPEEGGIEILSIIASKLKLEDDDLERIKSAVLKYAQELNDAKEVAYVSAEDFAMMQGDISEYEDFSYQDVVVKPTGGIDMNAIELDSNGESVEIEFDPAMLESLRETGVSGFVPVISHFRAVGLAEILK